MMRYLMLDVVFLTIAVGVVIDRHQHLSNNMSYLLKLTLSLLVLTIVFDNVIILLHIVSYHPAQLLGLYIYRAPLEDLAYTLSAVLLIPVLWEYKR